MRIVFYMISITNIKELKELKSKIVRILTMMTMRSLAGIPPLLGFLAKWQVVTELVKQDLIIVATTLLVMTAITLYIYLRTFMSTLRTAPNYEQNPSNTQKLAAALTLVNIPVLAV